MFHQRFMQTFVPVQAMPIPALPSLPVISVYGLSRAGVMMTATLANLGYRVIGVDCDPERTEALEQGPCALHKPELDNLLEQGRKRGRITASDDILAAVMESQITLVTQGYGIDAFGRPDAYPLFAMGRTLGMAIRHKGTPHAVMLNAPAAPGLCDAILAPAIAQGFGPGAARDYRVCEMPGTLRDDLSMQDFRRILADFMPAARA